jgi:hypothetical protein
MLLTRAGSVQSKRSSKWDSKGVSKLKRESKTSPTMKRSSHHSQWRRLSYSRYRKVLTLGITAGSNGRMYSIKISKMKMETEELGWVDPESTM